MGQNMTEKFAQSNSQALFTGSGNINKVRDYHSIYNRTYITFSGKYFNGNFTEDAYFNPWKSEIPLKGTDGNQNPPNFKDSSFIYVIDVFKAGKTQVTSTTANYNGINCRRFNLDKSFFQSSNLNKENENFYMDKYNGILNISSAKLAPVFVAKPYYLDSTNVPKSLIFSDKAKTNLITPNSDGETILDIEPYTGVTLGGKINLMGMYYLKPDELFTNKYPFMMPLYVLERNAAWSNSAVFF